MKIQINLLTALLLLSSIALCQPWLQNADFIGTPRIAGEAFSVNGKGYLAFGFNSQTGVRLNDIWEYSPTTDSWASKSNAIISPRSGSVVLNNDSCVLIGLGWDGANTFNDFYRYTPTTQLWDTLANYPGYGGRNSFYATYKNKAYIGGGAYGFNYPYHSDFWVYNINSDTWNLIGNLPFGNRSGGVSFTIDSIVYMGLGHDGVVDYKDLWAYNTVTNTWTQKADLPGNGRLGATFFVLNNSAFVGGGHRSGSGNLGTQSDYYRYSPKTDTWAMVPNTFSDSSRTFSSSFVINNTAFLVGGTSNYPAMLNDVWAYKSNTTVAIKQNHSKKSIELLTYPNPNKGELFISTNDKVLDGIFRIFNQTGQIVFEKRFDNEIGPIKIDISNFKNAIYYYSLVNENGQTNTGKIIKID